MVRKYYQIWDSNARRDRPLKNIWAIYHCVWPEALAIQPMLWFKYPA